MSDLKARLAAAFDSLQDHRLASLSSVDTAQDAVEAAEKQLKLARRVAIEARSYRDRLLTAEDLLATLGDFIEGKPHKVFSIAERLLEEESHRDDDYCSGCCSPAEDCPSCPGYNDNTPTTKSRW